MTLIERTYYHGCEAAGGPWYDTIAEHVTGEQAVEIAKRWRETIPERVMATMGHVPGDAKHFTFEPRQGVILARPFVPADTYNELEMAVYIGQGERYSVIARKEKGD